jgi:transcriptional regulator
MASERGAHVDLLQGTLDLIVLRTLQTMGPLHAYALTARLQQVSEYPVSLNQGTLYPALVRLEHKGWIKGSWQRTENNREAKYYSLTKKGVTGLEFETARWRRVAQLIETLLLDRA